MILADGSYRFLWMILTVAFTDDSYRWFLQGILIDDPYRFLQILTDSYIFLPMSLTGDS